MRFQLEKFRVTSLRSRALTSTRELRLGKPRASAARRLRAEAPMARSQATLHKRDMASPAERNHSERGRGPNPSR